jgi:hypothetical protein
MSAPPIRFCQFATSNPPGDFPDGQGKPPAAMAGRAGDEEVLSPSCRGPLVGVKRTATARAQQPGKLPTIGYLGRNTRSLDSPPLEAFVQRLRELGWIEGRTIAFEYR